MSLGLREEGSQQCLFLCLFLRQNNGTIFFFRGYEHPWREREGGYKKQREVGRGEGELGEESSRQREQLVQRLSWGWFEMQASGVTKEPGGWCDWSTGNG